MNIVALFSFAVGVDDVIVTLFFYDFMAIHCTCFVYVFLHWSLMLCTLMDYAVEKQLQNRVHGTRILAEDLL